MSRPVAEAWRFVSDEQHSAAEVLRARGLHRPSFSRAYYAAYSAVTAALHAAGHTTFGARSNPDHADVPRLITGTLRGLDHRRRRELATLVRRLRSAREDADYRPRAAVDSALSRQCLKYAASLRRAVGGAA